MSQLCEKPLISESRTSSVTCSQENSKEVCDIPTVSIPLDQDVSDTIEEDEYDEHMDIEKLLEFGLNSMDIQRLKENGIYTIKGIQMTTSKDLIGFNGLTENKVEKIKFAAKSLLEEPFSTALSLANKLRSSFHIDCGSETLNMLLGGGIQSRSITEVFGEFRTGKTQLAQTLCVTAQMARNHYGGGKVIYIDSEGTFRPGRIRQISDRYNLNSDIVLDNILYARAYTSDHQMELLIHSAAKLHEEMGVFKLLIMDSIMSLFRVDYSTKSELSDRQYKLGLILSRLQKISEEYNLAVLITNQISSDPNILNTFQQDSKRPIGGHVLAHASTTRINLRKGRGNIRYAKIYDSPDLAESETSFLITPGGIADLKEDDNENE